MTPEEKSLLERTYKLAEDNNAILRSLRRSNRWSTAIKVAYWGVIILLSFGAYYFIQPYLSFLTGLNTGSSQAAPGSTGQDYIQSLESLFK